MTRLVVPGGDVGKASRARQQRRTARAGSRPPGDSVSTVTAGERDPRHEALERLLRTNAPGKLSLAGAYAFGYAALGLAQQEGNSPHWHEDLDPLDLLFLGTAWPKTFHDEFEFANGRDTWLRQLHGTTHGKGIQRFVGEVVDASAELGLPVDDGELMLSVVSRLEAAGLDRRRIPARLLPASALQGARSVFGPRVDQELPDLPENADELIEAFWIDGTDNAYGDETPRSILRSGLHQLEQAGLPVESEAACLLVALYWAMLPNPGEHLDSAGEHAMAWALSIDERSPLVPVLDLMLLAEELPVDEALGRLFAVPAFTEPVPSEALIWTCSPGLALPAMAFELGFGRVATRNGVITPSERDLAGTRARMRLAQLRSGKGGSEDDEQELLSERLTAIRKGAMRRASKKSPDTRIPGEAQGPHSPFERLWDADGSSTIRWNLDTPEGQSAREALESQLQAFREKFGREPGPDDPLFFDPDAEEPTPLTEEYFADMLSELAVKASEIGIDPAYFLAAREVGYMVTTMNQNHFTRAEVIAYRRAVTRHRQSPG
ncbi:hypothetical protein ACFWRY_25535 [Streptomyces albidoflavus]